jgi:hypothetical protein
MFHIYDKKHSKKWYYNIHDNKENMNNKSYNIYRKFLDILYSVEKLIKDRTNHKEKNKRTMRKIENNIKIQFE